MNGLAVMESSSIQTRAVAALKPVTPDAAYVEIAQTLNDQTVSPLAFVYGDFRRMTLPEREEMILGLARQEIGIIAATANTGKTTTVNNIALSLACGRKFLPFLETAIPRRVAIIDFENTPTALRDDLGIMAALLTPAEQKMVDENLAIICGQRIGNEDLKLSNPDHFDAVIAELKMFLPDVVFIDTIASGFSIRSENDNAEVKERIMAPLRRIAIDLNAVVMSTLHIGKAKAEDGATRELVHRGRGASTFGDLAKVVFNLQKHTVPYQVIFEDAKLKRANKPGHKILELDPHTRWFRMLDAEPIVVRNNYEVVMDIFRDTETLTTAQIHECLKGQISRSSILANLASAVSNGHLMQPRRGVYSRQPALLNCFNGKESPDSPNRIREGLIGLSEGGDD